MSECLTASALFHGASWVPELPMQLHSKTE